VDLFHSASWEAEKGRVTNRESGRPMRQLHLEGGAVAVLAFHPDPAASGIHHMLHDGKLQAGFESSRPVSSDTAGLCLFFCLPPGFLAVPQYFNHVLVGSVALAITLAISSLIAYHIFREDTHQLLLYEILHINHC